MKFLISLLFLAISLNAQVLAVVNNQNITTEDVNNFLKSTNQDLDYKELDTKTKNLILHQTIEKKLLIQEALKDNLDKSADLQATLEEIKNSLLVESFMKNEFNKIKVTKDEITNYYNSHLYEFKQEKKLKARHIVVEDLKLAMDIIEKLNKASNKEEEFIKLASQYSLDGTRETGGNLGWFQKGDMVDEFFDATNNLKPQEYTKSPVKSDFGYHIIFLDEIQEPLTVALDKVYSNIENQIKMSKFQDIIDERIKQIKQKANIVIK